ncbi:MAG: helix-turn-helix domain-containing protein [Patescibacteria group bacterium]|jgi:cytoskeletal protein RodZ
MTGFRTKNIESGGFGSILKKARQKQKFTLEAIETETTVRRKYLKAFEEEKFQDLPDSVYAAGYLKKYCDFLAVPSDMILEEFKNAQTFKKNQSDMINPKKINDIKFIFTPRILFIAGISMSAMIFLGYIWFQFKLFTSAPPLTIITPYDQALVTEESINISGLTDEGAKLTINNEPIRIDESGKFETEIKLQDGLNKIEVVSENKVKKQSKKTLTVLARLK